MVVYKRVTNCKGPHTVNTANIGSTRDLISQNKMCIKATYLRCTVLTRPKKAETAVYCCHPTLSILVMLVSRNVFHVISALQSIAFRRGTAKGLKEKS